MPRQEKWIGKAVSKKGRGKLHKQLKIPQQQRIPTTLLKSIVKAPLGKRILNPTETGKGRVHVTRLLKQRRLYALNVRKSRR